jgi:hypothetical protein
MGNTALNVGFSNLTQAEADLLVSLLSKAKGATPSAPATRQVTPSWTSPQEALLGITTLSSPKVGKKGIVGWAQTKCRSCEGYGGKFCPSCGPRKADGSVSVSRMKREAKEASKVATPSKASTSQPFQFPKGW